jgi:hypothetical protein
MNRYEILKTSTEWGVCLFEEDGTCPVIKKKQDVCNDCLICKRYFSKCPSTTGLERLRRNESKIR